MSGARVLGAARRLRGVRQVPLGKLLVLGEMLMLARQHVAKLEPHERRRFIELMRIGHGRPGNLSPQERAELAALIAKADPRLFAGLVVSRLSPVPLPRRMVYGKR